MIETIIVLAFIWLIAAFVTLGVWIAIQRKNINDIKKEREIEREEFIAELERIKEERKKQNQRVKNKLKKYGL